MDNYKRHYRKMLKIEVKALRVRLHWLRTDGRRYYKAKLRARLIKDVKSEIDYRVQVLKL